MKKKLEILGLILTWLAVIVQLILMIQNRVAGMGETLIRFFSFFTILTNTLVALFFTTMALDIRTPPFHILRKQAAITAITVYILIVSIVYQVALRPIWDPSGIQMIIDELLHTIIPIYFFFYWIISLRDITLNIKPILYWLAYPAVYIVLILIRGYFSGYYPYPFLDFGKIGQRLVLQNIFFILVMTILLMYALRALGYFIKKKYREDLTVL